MNLKDNERIDDLQFKGLQLIQNANGFCFGIDSVLLADFAKEIKKNSNVIDLGTGTGVINILLSGKTNCSNFIGVEVQKDVAEMAERSVKLNNLENKIKIVNKDILDLKNVYQKGTFDVVVTNPPYKSANTGIINKEDKKIISRHETTANLEDFIKCAAYLLKDYGEFFMVHKPERLVDIFSVMRNENIEPKEIKFVYPSEKKVTNLILIKGVKNGNPFLKIDKNLYVHKENGDYTDEVLKIYGKKQ